MNDGQDAYGDANDTHALVNRLRRIEGQVRGIERMIENDRCCIDVLTQIAAVSTALQGVALKLLESHVSHCVADAVATGNQAVVDRKVDELLTAVQRFAHAL